MPPADFESGKPLNEAAVRNEAIVIILTDITRLPILWRSLGSSFGFQDAGAPARGNRTCDGRSFTDSRCHGKLCLCERGDCGNGQALSAYSVPCATATGRRDYGRQVDTTNSSLIVAPCLLRRKKGLWDRPDHTMPERVLLSGSGYLQNGLRTIQYGTTDMCGNGPRIDGERFVSGDTRPTVRVGGRTSTPRGAGLQGVPAAWRSFFDEDSATKRNANCHLGDGRSPPKPLC